MERSSPAPPRPAVEKLAAAVRKGAEAGIPVVVVELLAPGSAFTPSRGEVGAWYGPDETTIRALSPWGAGMLDAGLSLYPPPDPQAKRVIVLLLDGRNWLAHDGDLERALSELVSRTQPAP